MEEFWVCANCRSLNRAGSSKCYSCRTKFGSRPAEPEAVSGNAGSPAPLARDAAADFGAGPVAAPQYARLTALTPAAAAAGGPVAARGSRFPNPVSVVKGRIARSLSMRQSVSTAALGYLTAALLVLVLVMGTLLTLFVLPVGTHLLQHADPGAAWAQLSSGQHGQIKVLSIALAVTAVLTWSCFSLFVGLTTHNATGLGADQPLLSPYRAGTCWWRLPWTQARIAVGLIVPAVLVWQNYIILGLIAALVAVEIAHRHLEDQSSWLNRPARHLPDLYIKLGLEGSISSKLAALWSGCFRMANVMAILVSAAPMLTLLGFLAAVVAGRSELFTWQSAGLGAPQLIVALLVVNLAGWTAATIALLVPMTVGLTKRQQVRRTLVRAGRTRTGATRPGDAGALQSGRTATGYDVGEDNDDRIVERMPRLPITAPDPGGRGGFGAAPREDSGFGDRTLEERLLGAGLGRVGDPGLGGPGFGAPRPSGPELSGLSPNGPGREDSPGGE